jgi:hypothetical protein
MYKAERFAITLLTSFIAVRRAPQRNEAMPQIESASCQVRRPARTPRPAITFFRASKSTGLGTWA